MTLPSTNLVGCYYLLHGYFSNLLIYKFSRGGGKAETISNKFSGGGAAAPQNHTWSNKVLEMI